MLYFWTGLSHLISINLYQISRECFFIISSREACLKILMKVLSIFLCFVQIMKNMIYILGHKNTTRT